MLELPIDEIMSQTNPKLIFGDQGTSQQVDNSSAPESATASEQVSRTGDDVLDLSQVQELEITPGLEEVVPSEENQEKMPRPLIDFASANNLIVSHGESEKIDIIVLAPVGTQPKEFTATVEWIALTELSPQWAQTPNYVFIDSDIASTGILIEHGNRTTRDALVVVSNPSEILEIKSTLEQVYGLLDIAPQPSTVSLEKIEPIPVASERDIKTEAGYNGMWVKVPGKTFAVVSAVSGDEENIGRVLAVGMRLTELVAGSGKLLSTWKKIFLHSNGWSVGMHPIQGGAVLVELPAGLDLPEALKEYQNVSQQLMGILK